MSEVTTPVPVADKPGFWERLFLKGELEISEVIKAVRECSSSEAQAEEISWAMISVISAIGGLQRKPYLITDMVVNAWTGPMRVRHLRITPRGQRVAEAGYADITLVEDEHGRIKQLGGVTIQAWKSPVGATVGG